MAVDDWGLRRLREIMAAAGEEAPPNHHGTIDEIVGDTAYINFDDGIWAPYPLSDCTLLIDGGGV
ncbi:MAG: hypothetical protein ABIJ75_03530 [Actinomycetota bacterium]